jgi:hypothetical protein
MRSTADITTSGRAWRALVGMGTVAGVSLLVPGMTGPQPVGCTQTGNNFVCTAGIGLGEVLSGTAVANVITITGRPVNGSVDALGGNDTINVTGTTGASGPAGVPGANGTVGTPAGSAGGNGGVGSSGGVGGSGLIDGGAGTDSITVTGGLGGNGCVTSVPVFPGRR